MAPIAMILGGTFGTVSAVFGWLLFGLSFWGAVQLYFAVALAIAAGLIAVSLLRSSPRKSAETPELQSA